MNYISRNVKLYPKDYSKINESKILEICKEIQIGSWGPCLYNWNKEDNALELLYVRKYRSKTLMPEIILDSFHYWEIEGDEGNSSDIIIGQSKNYFGTTEGINSSEKKGYWDYGNTCYYQSNKVIVTGEIEKIKETLNEVFLTKREEELKIDNQFSFEKKIILNYASCSNRMCIDEFSKENVLKYKIGTQLYTDGRMHQVISGDFKGIISRDRLFGKLFKIMRNNGIIKTIEFLNNERITHKYYFKNKTLMSLSGDYWDNCIDKEYVSFNKWYQSELKRQTVENQG